MDRDRPQNGKIAAAVPFMHPVPLHAFRIGAKFGESGTLERVRQVGRIARSIRHPAIDEFGMFLPHKAHDAVANAGGGHGFGDEFVFAAEFPNHVHHPRAQGIGGVGPHRFHQTEHDPGSFVGVLDHLLLEIAMDQNGEKAAQESGNPPMARAKRVPTRNRGPTGLVLFMINP